MNWDPTTEEEVAQNVRSLVALPRGAQPFARALGILPPLDEPVPVASARLAASLAAQIKAYEPRAKVSKITVAATVDGQLSPTVRLA